MSDRSAEHGPGGDSRMRPAVSLGPDHVVLHWGDEKIPLLAVFVGDRPEGAGNQLVPTWMLYVHPDWPSDVDVEEAFFRSGARIEIDRIPSGAAVVVPIEVIDGVAVVPRHPG